MSAPSALYDALEAIRAEAITILGLNAPAESFVAASLPPLECSRLTVHLDSLQPEASTTVQPDRTRMRAVYLLARALITLTRCVNVGDEAGHPPTGTQIQAIAQALLLDVHELYGGLIQAIDGDVLLPGNRYVRLDAAVPVGQQGGLAGWQLPITFQIDSVTG